MDPADLVERGAREQHVAEQRYRVANYNDGGLNASRDQQDRERDAHRS